MNEWNNKVIKIWISDYVMLIESILMLGLMILLISICSSSNGKRIHNRTLEAKGECIGLYRRYHICNEQVNISICFNEFYSIKIYSIFIYIYLIRIVQSRMGSFVKNNADVSIIKYSKENVICGKHISKVSNRFAATTSFHSCALSL